MISAEAFLRDPGPLRPVYLVQGEEPFYHQAVMDRVSALAHSAGITVRQRWDGESAQADWAALDQMVRTPDLFGGGQFVHIRLPKGQPGRTGSEWIRRWCQAPEARTVVFISSGRLEARQLKQAWVQAIEQAGVVVQARPLPAPQLPGWCQQRARAKGLTLTVEAAALLAERSEGNLLAADQALEILRLRHGEGACVDVPAIMESVADQAHYDLFALGDALLAGETEQALHVLHRLRQEGVEMPLVLWAVAREIRLLHQLALSPHQAETLFRQQRVWRSRQAAYRQAAARLPAQAWGRLLQRLHEVDLRTKGVLPGSPWREMEQILMQAGEGNIQ